MSNRDIVTKFASSNRSDISGHLLQIYDTVIKKSPKIIVELGVRKGMSTFTLSRAAQDTNATLISIDIKDCSKFCNWNKWKFVKMNDLYFADIFKDKIDVLFIDTNHSFEHTINELKKFLPRMNKQGIIIMHDTNIRDPKKSRVGDAINFIFNIKGNWKINFEIENYKAKIMNFAHNNGMAFIFLK